MSGITNGQSSSYPHEGPVTDKRHSESLAGNAEAFAIELTSDEVAAAGGKVSPVTLREVQLADARVRATGVLEKLPEWRHEDRGAPGIGGQPKIIDDRMILITLLLLVVEKTPQWISEISNLLSFRLTPEARAYLGLPAGSTSLGDQSA